MPTTVSFFLPTGEELQTRKFALGQEFTISGKSTDMLSMPRWNLPITLDITGSFLAIHAETTIRIWGDYDFEVQLPYTEGKALLTIIAGGNKDIVKIPISIGSAMPDLPLEPEKSGVEKFLGTSGSVVKWGSIGLIGAAIAVLVVVGTSYKKR